ncbi:hypothetical protein UFOVP116_50 [uncultured Caudovirales phage]|uniref:Uncharacterized protein n=1 Tax=uncultured Caudovirales phage TaxID=2100421 RepID=A0A6J5L8D2_9CAUD|nr:hypothetical protein UFOVP116_50 [uncultured Caudovirales phage]
MSIEVETLTELYSIMKQYIPPKDRLEAADNIISVMVDLLSDQDLVEFSAFDSLLKKAAKDYSIDADGDDGDDEYGYDE